MWSLWFKRKSPHIHDWQYVHKSLSGWSVVRCTSCGAEDIS
jgi:hypothetical protein